jgi:hypothetical protein
MKPMQIFFRCVYGNQLAYPANQIAVRFARLLGAKTFTEGQLRQIKDLGIEVESRPDPMIDNLQFNDARFAPHITEG